MAAIFGKELLASLDKDGIFYWSDTINENTSSAFSFNCEIAAKVIKAPERVMNKLNNIAIVK